MLRPILGFIIPKKMLQNLLVTKPWKLPAHARGK